MSSYFTPGVYFEKIDAEARSVASLRTDIAGFVGLSEKGPLNRPVRLESWKQFQSVFGTFIPHAFLAYAVFGFFENGGAACWVVRVADLGKAAAAELILFDKTEESLVLSQAVARGTSGLTLTAAGTLAQDDYILIGRDEHSYRLTAPPAGGTITVSPPLKHAYAAGAAVRKVIPTVRVSAINEGRWGRRVKARLIETAGASTVSAAAALQPASRLYSVAASVMGFETGSLVRVVQNRSGLLVEKYHRAASVDAASRKIVWDAPLEKDTATEKGFDLTQSFSLVSREFTLIFSLDGKVKEVFKGLSMDPEHDGYLEDVINGTSELVEVENLSSPSDWPDTWPDPEKMGSGTVTLEGGTDGIETVEAEDLIGDFSLDEKLGLRGFEDVEDISMIAVPDLMIEPAEEVSLAPPPPADPCHPAEAEETDVEQEQPETSPVFSAEDRKRVQRAMIEHCEVRKDRIAILDCPPDLDITDLLDWRLNFDSKFGALYAPWIYVGDPLRPRGRLTRRIPPSGHLAGVYARTDLTKGVHKAPANEEIEGAKDVDFRIDDAAQDLLNPEGVNVLRVFPGRGVCVWGARTTSSDPDWRFINIRRLLIMIEESVREAMQWAVFEPHDAGLRNTVRVAVSTFLEDLWRAGALKGKSRDEAFFVTCDETNNPAATVDAGRLVTDVGVAPARPAEFIVFRIGKAKETIEILKEGVD